MLAGAYVLFFAACGGSVKAPLTRSGGARGGGGNAAGGDRSTDGVTTGGAAGTGSGGSANAATGGFVAGGNQGSGGLGGAGAPGTAGASSALGGGGFSSGAGEGGAGGTGVGAAGGVGGDMAATGVQQCALLAADLCMSGSTCVAAYQTFTCEAQLRLEFGCERASGANFATCRQDTQSAGASCSGLFPDGALVLPSACLPPIQAIPLSDAQSKCYELVDQFCTRSLECSGKTATSIDVQNCEDDVTTNLQDGIPCLLAAAVGAGYAQCAAAIPTASCINAGAGGGAGTPMMTVPSCASAITFAP